MINGRRISVVLPAYNAEFTLSRTVAELDREIIDEIVLVDDASTDQTVSLARELGLEPILHDVNLGYGANQKTCYRRAIELGADIVVMVHPDYQYSPLLVPAMAAMIAYGEYDMVLGSRILAQNSVARGMPRYKYVSNRFLTFVENIALGQKLSEYHTGLRAFSTDLLARLPIDRNSDDFVFDNQIIAQAVIAGARIGEVSCPTRYMKEASSINWRRSITYGIGVLRTCADYWLHKHGLRSAGYLDVRLAQVPGGPVPGTDEALASDPAPAALAGSKAVRRSLSASGIRGGNGDTGQCWTRTRTPAALGGSREAAVDHREHRALAVRRPAGGQRAAHAQARHAARYGALPRHRYLTGDLRGDDAPRGRRPGGLRRLGDGLAGHLGQGPAERRLPVQRPRLPHHLGRQRHLAARARQPAHLGRLSPGGVRTDNRRLVPAKVTRGHSGWRQARWPVNHDLARG